MKKNNTIVYEPEDDILNIWLSKKPYDYADQYGDVIVHYTEDNEPVYIEILDASKLLKDLGKTIPSNIQQEMFSGASTSVAHRIR